MSNSLPSFVLHNLTPFKDLWAHLSEEEKTSACTIHDLRILSDLADTANNTLLVCELSKALSKKRLIKWKKEVQKDSDKSYNTHTYQFMFNDKEILENHIANMLSSIYLVIHTIPKQNQGAQLKSFISIQKDKIDSILTIIDEADFNLDINAEADSKLKSEDLFEIYSFFVTRYSQKEFFNNSDSLTLRKLFCKLLAVSFVLKSNLFSFFQSKVSYEGGLSNPSTSQRDLSSKLTNLALYLKSQNNPFVPSNMKTVSELELESAGLDHKQGSGWSSNRRSSSRKQSGISSGGESVRSSNNIKEDHTLKKSNKATYNEQYNSSMTVRQELETNTSILSVYDGISVGDLLIPFQKSDVLMYSDENEIKSVTSKVNTVKEPPAPTPVYLVDATMGYPQQAPYFFYAQVHPIHGFALAPIGGFVPVLTNNDQSRKNSYNSDHHNPKGGNGCQYNGSFTPRNNRERSPDSPGNYANGEYSAGANSENYDKNIVKDNEKSSSNQKDKQKLKLPPRLKRFRETELPS